VRKRGTRPNFNSKQLHHYFFKSEAVIVTAFIGSCGEVTIAPCLGAALCYHASICDDLFLDWFSRERARLLGRCRRWRIG
jgi:hypothetical protein